MPSISTESFGSDSISVNGQDPRNNNYMLDGGNNNDDVIGQRAGSQARTPIEAIQEFQVITGQYDAQYGRTAGGVVNMSLKSGTNSFHGEVYDFMRRKALAANSFLLNSRNAPRTDQYIDQYGFSVDGPVFKNKTFFLFTGEKYREGTPAPLFGAVPTPAFKNGDFSGLVDASGRLITIYDPATGVGRALQQGPVLELGREGGPQLQLEGPRVLPLGREQAERDRQ